MRVLLAEDDPTLRTGLMQELHGLKLDSDEKTRRVP